MAAVVAQLVALAISSPAIQNTRTHVQWVRLQGTVVDTNDVPQEGFQIGITWKGLTDGRISPAIGTTTDAAGKFSFEIPNMDKKHVVIAMSPDQKRGGYGIVNKSEIPAKLVIRVRNNAQLRVGLDLSRLEKKHETPFVGIILWPDQLYMIWIEYVNTYQDKLVREILVPIPATEFEYSAIIQYPDAQTVQTTRAKVDGKGFIDLGTVGMRSNKLSRLNGKVPPKWNLTDSRGAGQKCLLSDWAGKWIILCCWSVHDRAFVLGDLPRIRSLDLMPTEKRESFEIVLFHDHSVAQVKEIIDTMSDPVLRQWIADSKTLKVLCDGTGKTFDLLGIDKCPKILVIDPNGRVAETNQSIDWLEAKFGTKDERRGDRK